MTKEAIKHWRLVIKKLRLMPIYKAITSDNDIRVEGKFSPQKPETTVFNNTLLAPNVSHKPVSLLINVSALNGSRKKEIGWSSNPNPILQKLYIHILAHTNIIIFHQPTTHLMQNMSPNEPSLIISCDSLKFLNYSFLLQIYPRSVQLPNNKTSKEGKLSLSLMVQTF